jgi:reactive intermediate/imine deaminase
MVKEVVTSNEVVEGMGPFSQCTRAGNMLFISGQVAWDRDGNLLSIGDAGGQARQAFRNMGELLQAAGGTLDDIVKLTFYLTNMDDWEAVRKVREQCFNPPYPAATSVEVSSLRYPEFLLEVDAIAVVGDAAPNT